MKRPFQEIIDQLHDARIFGFLFDNDREGYKYSFYIYVQLFGDYDDGLYELRKALIRLNDARLKKLSIANDLSQGQFFITGVDADMSNGELTNFKFSFNSDDLELNVSATNIEIILSDQIERSRDQYLKTEWSSLLN